MAVGFWFFGQIFGGEAKRLMVTLIPQVQRRERIPLDMKIREKLGLVNVPTDRSVARGASQDFQAESLPRSWRTFSPEQMSGKREEHDGGYHFL
jgi:hypothetical protein